MQTEEISRRCAYININIFLLSVKSGNKEVDASRVVRV